MAEPEVAGTHFVRLGGEAGVRTVVDRFYDLMDLDSGYVGIRALHPADMSGSRDKLFWFLCGWLGGPDHYITRFGHPMLRARHLPYTIGISERDQWMACMMQAMQDLNMAPDLAEDLANALYGTADWMRNRGG